jgi:hypothetical protein
MNVAFVIERKSGVHSCKNISVPEINVMFVVVPKLFRDAGSQLTYPGCAPEPKLVSVSDVPVPVSDVPAALLLSTVIAGTQKLLHHC